MVYLSTDPSRYSPGSA